MSGDTCGVPEKILTLLKIKLREAELKLIKITVTADRDARRSDYLDKDEAVQQQSIIKC